MLQTTGQQLYVH